MIFQGQEFLEDGWFPERTRSTGQVRELRRHRPLYRDLIRLRRDRVGDTRGLRGHVNVHQRDDRRKVLAYHRWTDGGPGDDVVVVGDNFSHEARGVYRIGFPREGPWKLRLNTDWSGYSEDFGGLPKAMTSRPRPQESDGLPWSAEVAVGPYSALIFSQDGGGKPAA